jgi:hypothetical protein
MANCPEGDQDLGDIHRHFGSHSLWDKYSVPKSPTIDVTEVWGHDSSGSLVVENKTLSSMDLVNWLNEAPEKFLLSETHRRIARLVWVGENPKTSRWSPSRSDLSHILETWNIQHAFDYAQSCFAGVSALPQLDGVRSFTTTYHPKLAIAWSHGATGSVGNSTQGVMFAGAEQRVELVRTLESRWTFELAAHAMFPAFLCSLVLASEFDATAGGIKSDVREVEVRTGHHRFSHRQEQPAAGELGHLSARMSGCAAKLANGTRKLKVVAALNEFILEHSGDEQCTNSRGRDELVAWGSKLEPTRHSSATISSDSHAGSGKSLLTHHIRLMQHRLQMQLVDNEYVQQRVQVQIAALFHLIAQQDNSIAFETASSTRSIAHSSQQDSSSMKMLALVAMFFLPPSFVAALFSTPLFDWDAASQTADHESIGVGIRPQFKLFWAVTIPITALTFVVYGMGILVQKRKLNASQRLTSKPLETVP